MTKWRVKALLALQLRDAKNSQLENLLIRFQVFRPDLVPQKFVLRKTKISKLTKVSKMENTFAAIWNESEENLFGLNAPLDLLTLEHLDKGGADLASKRYRHTLIPPLVEPPSKRRKLDLVSLKECKTIGDVLRNVTKLSGVSQAMTLLSSPSSFFLLLLTPDRLQERLSLTLFYTLHNEFFSMSRTKEPRNRKLKLLIRINQLQDWLQQGAPVVGRFLALYLTTWNGSDYFVEICKMIVYLQITDFSGKPHWSRLKAGPL